MPPRSLEDFAKEHGLEIGTMTIEAAVSQFPRDIRIPMCPKCGHFIYLFHSERKPDPFIGAKVLVGILGEKNIPPRTWLATCWTEDCDFHLEFKEEDLALCPECNQHFMEYSTLYDHMKFQCNEAARDSSRIREAGAGMYIAELVALEFKEDDEQSGDSSSIPQSTASRRDAVRYSEISEVFSTSDVGSIDDTPNNQDSPDVGSDESLPTNRGTSSSVKQTSSEEDEEE